MKIGSWLSEKRLYLFLFPLLFILNHFFQIVTPKDPKQLTTIFWVTNFAVAYLICLAVYLGVFKLISLKFNARKSAHLTWLLLFPIFFFQDIFFSLEKVLILGLRARIILPLFMAAIGFIVFKVLRSNRSFNTLTQYLNVTTLLLALHTTVFIGIRFESNQPKILSPQPTIKELTCTTCPDIYFFLLDAYTSNKSLRDHYNFDNSLFCDELEKMDFSVADESRSLHTKTAYSLSATLNFNQIKDLEKYQLISNVIKTNGVVSSLQAKNYEIFNYSIFDVADQPAFYSLTISSGSALINSILESSIFNMALFDILLKVNLFEINTAIFQKTVQEGKRNTGRPKFFYSHILAPHPPFVMDENGREIGFFKQAHSFANPAAYVRSVQGLNNIVAQAVQEILKANPNAIIVIMGDHGYRYLSAEDNQGESQAVFLAYHGPKMKSQESLLRSNEIFDVVFRDLNEAH